MQSRKIYNRIDILRKDLKISRKELADRVGVNYQTIGYLEREEYNPSLDLAFRICEVFRIPVEYVFSTQPMEPISVKELKKQVNSKEALRVERSVGY